MTWLHGPCYHYHSAKNLIRFAKKVSRNELEKTRIVLKLLPKVPDVTTDDIDILLVLTSATYGPNAPIKLQGKYDRIAETLSDFSRDNEDFGTCVDDGFRSTETSGARFFFFEMIDSILTPFERIDMKPVSKKRNTSRSSTRTFIEYIPQSLATDRSLWSQPFF